MVYTREFLLSELNRFAEENRRNPRQCDMRSDLGFPSKGSYRRYFGTFNNALIEAGLAVNEYHRCLDGSEVCSNCGVSESNGWFYLNDRRLCKSCYRSGYRVGYLDPASNTGFGFISQRIVAKSLGLSLEHDCNCTAGFGSFYDLYDKNKYGYINVKAATLNTSNGWVFTFRNKYIPDTYLLLGFSYGRTDIIHTWVISTLTDLVVNKPVITVFNTNISLYKMKPYEVDSELYNDTYHDMSLENCSALQNKSVVKVKPIDERVNNIFMSCINKNK